MEEDSKQQALLPLQRVETMWNKGTAMCAGRESGRDTPGDLIGDRVVVNSHAKVEELARLLVTMLSLQRAPLGRVQVC